MLEIFAWVFTAAAITGNILNVYKNKWCYIFWNLSNVFFVIYNFNESRYHEAIMFAVFTGFCTWGFIRWNKEEKEKLDNSKS